eukprot:659078-Lingulodinium_polyedra.AAC.1
MSSATSRGGLASTSRARSSMATPTSGPSGRAARGSSGWTSPCGARAPAGTPRPASGRRWLRRRPRVRSAGGTAR